jgi:hypothetical protein
LAKNAAMALSSAISNRKKEKVVEELNDDEA